MRANTDKPTAWTPTKVQFVYRHLNQRYYVRTFAAGKEKWTSLLSVAKNRMKEHLDAAERQKSGGESVPATGKLTFGEVTETYRQQLQASDVRPNTKAYRDAGIKLVFKSWEGIADLNVRRINSKTVEDWLRRFKANAKPHVPRGATAGARNATGASATTIKCAMDAVRQILDIAVASGHLYANPARNVTVSEAVDWLFATIASPPGVCAMNRSVRPGEA